jgi:sorting nexin-29
MFQVGSFQNGIQQLKLKADSVTLKVNGEFESSLNTKIQSIKKIDQSSNLNENLSLSELREVALTMITRKEHIEELNRTLKANLNEQLGKNAGLEEKLGLLEKEMANSKQFYENRLQNVETENKLLKDQLKKYVSAVQLIRNNSNNSNTSAESSSPLIPPMPAVNENLKRDYSYEAEQYEKKLIQVC